MIWWLIVISAVWLIAGLLLGLVIGAAIKKIMADF